MSGKWMYTHTVRKFEDGEWVETRTNVSRQIYRQLLAQVIQSSCDKVKFFNGFDFYQYFIRGNS